MKRHKSTHWFNYGGRDRRERGTMQALQLSADHENLLESVRSEIEERFCLRVTRGDVIEMSLDALLVLMSHPNLRVDINPNQRLSLAKEAA